jgi:hypothetical protein
MNWILESDVNVDAVLVRESVWRCRVSRNTSYCWPATATGPRSLSRQAVPAVLFFLFLRKC